MAYKTAAELFGDNGVWGVQVPIDTGPPSGVYDPTNRGIGFGEQLTSAIANRSHYALALNTDDLNIRLDIFEADGLDAAYRGGALATPGSGRLITKDGGAVETTSALATQYADDVANAHFRADALGDTASGGGFDFRGSAAAAPAYGILSRINFSPSGASTNIAATEAVTLNPTALGADIVRFPNPVYNGSLTDVALDGMDFLEITNAGPDNGVYRVVGLSGSANTDLTVQRLDGTTPAFGVNTSGDARYFIANALASGLAAGLTAGLSLSATAAENAVLAIFGRDTDGLLGTGPTAALAFYPQRDDGQSPGALAYFTSTGRLKSGVTGGQIGSKAREIERAEGGLPIVNVNKSAGSGDGYHEIGVLVTDQDGVTSSYTGLETRGRLIESLTLGIGASVNGEYTAALGVIELTDSDGTPPPPPGGGVLHGQWTTLVQPGSTLVKILTGVGAGRYYLLSSVTVDANPTNRDTMTLRRLDGTALSVGELPASGPLTFAFYARTTVGGRTAPIAVNSGPGSWTAPTDVTPNAVFHPATDVYGGADSDGVTAAMFAGNIIGARIDNTPTVAAGSHTLDVSWSMSRDGDLYTQGEVTSSAAGSADYARVSNGGLAVVSATFSASYGSASIGMVDLGTAAFFNASTAIVQVNDGGPNTGAVTPTTVSVTDSLETVTAYSDRIEWTGPGTLFFQADRTGVSAQDGATDFTTLTATGVSVADLTAGVGTSVLASSVESPDFKYVPALSRSVITPLADGISDPGAWEPNLNPPPGYWESLVGGAHMLFPLRIPNDCTLVNILVVAKPSAAPGPLTQRLTVFLYRIDHDFVTPGLAPSATEVAREYADGTTNLQLFDLAAAPNGGFGTLPITLPATFSANSEYLLRLEGTSGSVGDQVHSIQLQLSLNRPGVL